MRILKYKKIGIDKYKVVFENTELILYEDVIIKYNLISKKEINIEEIEKILEDNKFYEMYNYALKLLSNKLRSKKEIIINLQKKDVSAELIDKIIDMLDSLGYLNEANYISAYINDSVNLKNIGPYKIKEELINLGLPETEIDNKLMQIDEEVWMEKINKLVNKKISLNKKYSLSMLKKKISTDLYLKGFDREMINSILEKISINESDNLYDEYNKVYKKYSNRYTGKELKNKIIIYFQRQGYTYNEINRLIENDEIKN